MKTTTFQNNQHTNIIISKPDITPEECRENLKHIHATIISQHLSSRKKTELLTPHPMTFIHSKPTYACKTGTSQSQQITTLAKLPTYSEP